MKTTLLITIIGLIGLRVIAEDNSSIVTVESRLDNPVTSGLVEDAVFLDFSTSSASDNAVARPLDSQANYIWSGESPVNTEAVEEESELATFLPMSVEELTSYLEKFPDDVWALTVYAVRLYQAGELDQSLKVFTRLNHLNAGFQRSAEVFSGVIVKAGDYTNAIKHIRTLLDQLPDNPVLRFNLACSYALDHQPNEALYHLFTLANMQWDDLFYHLSDKDLKNIFNDPRLAEFVQRLSVAKRVTIVNEAAETTFPLLF